MTMREGWANAYVTDYGPTCGKFVDLGGFTSEANANAWARLSGPPAFRIHVKLKPEGAPERYACDGERLAWEREPFQAATARSLGMVCVYSGP